MIDKRDWDIIINRNSCPFWDISYCRKTRKMIEKGFRMKEHYEYCSYDICPVKVKNKTIEDIEKE